MYTYLYLFIYTFIHLFTNKCNMSSPEDHMINLYLNITEAFLFHIIMMCENYKIGTRSKYGEMNNCQAAPV